MQKVVGTKLGTDYSLTKNLTLAHTIDRPHAIVLFRPSSLPLVLPCALPSAVPRVSIESESKKNYNVRTLYSSSYCYS